MLKSAFWPDVQINYPSQTKARTIDEFDDDLTAHKQLSTHWGHLITNETVDVSADVAHVETYVTEFSTFKND